MKSKSTYINISFIINLLFMLSFLIYVKKTPLETETQPFFIFLITTTLIFFIKLKLTKRDIFLVLHLVVLTLYIIYQILFYRTGIVDYLTYLIGPITYLVFLNRINSISVLLLKRIIIFFLILTIVSLFKMPVLNDILVGFSEIFIGRTGWGEGSGFRGVSLLTPEPSYFAFFLILLMSLIDIKIKNENPKSFKIYWIILFFIALATKSALVFFYLIAYIFGKQVSKYTLKRIKEWFNSKNIFLLLSFIIILSIPFLFLKESRPVQVIENVSKSVSDGNAFELLFRESSGSTRFIVNALGVITVNVKPLGWGIGEFKNHYYEAAPESFKKIILRHEVLKVFYEEKRPLKTQTYFTNLVGDIGLFSIPFLLFILISFFKAKGEIRSGLKWTIILMLIIVQGQISNPVIWILLAIMNSRDWIDSQATVKALKGNEPQNAPI